MAETHIDNIIANAIEMANTLSAKAESSADHVADKVKNTSTSWGFGSYAFDPAVTAEEPQLSPGDDPTGEYEELLDKLLNTASAKLAEFLAEYFPAEDTEEDQRQLLAEIEAQVFQRARERAIEEGQRQEQQVLTGYSARGFSMPPGMMYAQAQEIRSDVMGKVGEAASTVATRVAEMEIQHLRFVIEQKNQLRIAGINAATDYIRIVMSASDAAGNAASIGTNQRAKMVAATADFYRARLTKDQIVNNTKSGIMQAQYQNSGMIKDFLLNVNKADTDAVVSAAEVYARTASAALSSLNSIVSSSQASFG